MIGESNGLGEVEFLGCLETEVPISGVKRQRTCVGLGQSLQKLVIKQQAKYSLNLTALRNIIWQFNFTRKQQYVIVFNQKHCEAVANGRLAFPPTQKIWNFFTYYMDALEELRGLDFPTRYAAV